MPLEICSKWLSLLWNNFESNFNEYHLFDFISEKENISNLTLNNNNINSKISFIESLIAFVKKMKYIDDIFNKNNILMNIKGDLVNKSKIYYFDINQVFFNLLYIVNYDYQKQMLHDKIQYLYNDIKFNKFILKDAIEIVKEGINSENSIKIMQYVSKEDYKREELFQYAKTILNGSIQKIQFDVSNFDKNDIIKIEEMFKCVDKIIIDKIIKKIKDLDIKMNIQFLHNFVKFLKTKFSLEEFNKLKIFPNQNYELCLFENLYKDGFEDDSVKDIIYKVFSIDLRNQLVIESFSKITKFEVNNFYKFSTQISECLSKGAQSFKNRMYIYSLICQYSFFENNEKKILELLHFFFGLQIEHKELKQEDCWLSNLTKQVINMAINEIIQFISQFSNIKEITSKIDSSENKLIDMLNILYSFSIEGKIFPNLFGDLKSKENIFIIYDNQVNNELLNQLLEILIELQNSDEIKHSILNQSIQIQDEKIKEIKLIDLNFLASKIMEIYNNDKIIGKDNSDIIQKLFNIIDLDPKMRAAFSPLIEEKVKKIPLSMLDIIYSFIDDESDEIGYGGEALVYEQLLKSGKFKSVNWLAHSNVKTSKSIKLANGNSYYIGVNNQSYDIIAEDFDENIFYIEVKSKKDFMSKQRSNLGLSRNQIDFANNINGEKEYFVLAIVLNVMDENPFFLFLKKVNQEFIQI